MRNRLEKTILKSLIVIGIGSFFNLIRKPPVKDWLIIFFLKSYIATLFDNLAVKKGYIKYPVKLFRTFDISAIFSYLVFPITCVYFNQLTKNSGVKDILLKCLYFSAPSAVVEHFLEKKTKLIKYKKSWTSFHSFLSIASTFLLVRFIMIIIQKAERKQQSKSN